MDTVRRKNTPERRTYASLGCFVTAWMPLLEPYRPDDSMKDEERLVL